MDACDYSKEAYIAAIVYDGQVYCVDCMPAEISIDDLGVYPIFADSEWDQIPVCCICGQEHDYMVILDDDDDDDNDNDDDDDDDNDNDDDDDYYYNENNDDDDDNDY